MTARAHLAAILALAGVAACQEPPSFRLRWAIEGYERLHVAACSESGLFLVRARAYVAPGEYVDERLYPCFDDALADPAGTVSGPTLSPGRYAIELRGVDRAGAPWDEAADEGSVFEPEPDESALGCTPVNEAGAPVAGSACRPNELVCDCQRLEVVAEGAAPSSADGVAVEQGSTVDLPEFVLTAPPQCIDGMDNDRDGLVDGADPSCNVDFGDGTEGVPVGVTELRLDLTLLGRNTALADCSALPLRNVRVTYGEGDAQEIVLQGPCALDRPYVALLRLPAGPATFTVTGYDGTSATASPVTHPKSFRVEISPFGGTVQRSIDFASSDFLEPIVSPIRVTPHYVSEVGEGGIARSSCGPVVESGVPHGSLVLDRLRVQVLNGHGSPLEPPVTYGDGTPLDGTETIPCTAPLATPPLEWGSYAMVVEGLSAAGEVCFSNVGSPALLAPSGSPVGLALYLPRVYDADGQVPASCRDCEVDADCGFEDELFCVEGVCQQGCVTNPDPEADPAADDDQCQSVELGDLGFVCEADLCQRPSSGP
jgi:hypothetical protein